MKRKRANHAGSVYQIKGGRWRAAVTIDGKQVERTRQTEAEAHEALASLLRIRDGDPLAGSEQQPLARYLHAWLSETKRHDLRPHTLANYTSAVRHIEKRIGRIRLIDLRPYAINRMRSQMLDAGYKPGTVNNVLRVLRSALADATRQEIISKNPADAVKFVPRDAVERPTLSADHLAALLQHTEGTEYHALWLVLAGMGLRVGEALALTWEDIDGDVLHITATATQGMDTAGRVLGPAKTRKSRRDLLIPPPVWAALQRHERLVRDRQRQKSARWHHLNLVFPGRDGNIRATSAVNIALARHLEAVGAPAMSAHSLRHTFATLHLSAGTRMEVVRDMLGHSSIGMTADLYSHVERQLFEGAAETMTAILTGRAG